MAFFFFFCEKCVEICLSVGNGNILGGLVGCGLWILVCGIWWLLGVGRKS